MVGILLGKLRPIFQYLVNFQPFSQNILKPHFGRPVTFSSIMFMGTETMVTFTHQQDKTLWSHIVFISILQNMEGILQRPLR